jgi:hypothetical protein
MTVISSSLTKYGGVAAILVMSVTFTISTVLKMTTGKDFFGIFTGYFWGDFALFSIVCAILVYMFVPLQQFDD